MTGSRRLAPFTFTTLNRELNAGQINIRPFPPEELTANAKNFPLIPPSHKPNVDRVFLRQLHAILRIAFPSWQSKEVFILVLHSTFLVLRTVLSVAVARLDGRIVRDLVRYLFQLTRLPLTTSTGQC